MSFALRPCKFFVDRLLAAVGMPKSAVFPSGVVNPRRHVTCGPMFHADLDFWRWLAANGLDASGECFSSPMYNIIIRRPSITMFSDASKRAVGGYCQETGRYFRYDLSPEERSRFVGSSKSVVGINDMSINVLELPGMLLGAWLLIIPKQRRPALLGDCVSLRGDNEASVAWIQRCRGGLEPRSGALMRLLGVLEVASGWNFQASHVPGVLNSTADGISRWNRADVHTNLVNSAPNIPWQEVELGGTGRALCSSVLDSSSCGAQLRCRLSVLIWDNLEPS